MHLDIIGNDWKYNLFVSTSKTQYMTPTPLLAPKGG